MIKIKDFSELTKKDKASIRELIDDCIRYEQLELAVPDLEAEEGTAYLFFSATILKSISRSAPSPAQATAAKAPSPVSSRS